MSAPQIITRALTFHFAQSVSVTTGLPDIMEIALLPLNDASSSNAGATFAGGLKTANIALSDPVNSATFQLIPTFSPGLTVPVNYRVMWRAGPQARTFTYDFVMPDQDLSWEQLIGDVSNIIDGTVYLQQADLGVPGRVARLDNNGHVVDANGVLVASSEDVNAVSNSLGVEVLARQGADNALRATLETELTTQVAATLHTSQVYTDNQVTGVNLDITVERASRIAADADLESQLNSHVVQLQDELDSLEVTTGGTTTALSSKADLDSFGKLLLSEVPDAILTDATAVPNQAAMLALTYPTVHKGDLAVRPDGVFLLINNDPSQLGNWVSLTTVSSVNGHRGAVSLAASDLNAIPVGGAISQSQVTGLATALGLKADSATATANTAAIQAIQADSTYVHTTAGVIPSTLLDANMVYLNSLGQLVHKDGTVIPVSGGGGAVFSVNTHTGAVVLTASDVGAIPVGGSIVQTQVTGLSTALTGKADLVSGTVPLSELPNIPQSQVTDLVNTLNVKADLVSGLIPLGEIPSIPLSQVSSLAAIIGGNQLTTGTNAVNRVGSLEGRVSSLEAGGGGGGGTVTTTVFYDSANTATPVTDFTQVLLHSPWGIDSDGTITGTIGTWYYLHFGVRDADVAYPYITPNGHLNLRKWNEAGAAEPVYALQSDLAALTTTVGTKASTASVTTLSNTVTTKADQSALTALSMVVDTKANTADLNNLATTVGGKASQSDLNTTNSVVATKADQSALTALTTTVGTKANQSALDTTNATVAGHTTALTTKADLVGGTVPLSQIPTNIPQTSVTGLSTSLNGKADLSGPGTTVPLAQLPNIPQTQVTGLGTSLGAKADLVGGTVPMSQLPASALPNVVAVANRAAMLALTSATVQYGDTVLITGTTDKGTYVLTGADPSQFVNWTKLITPDAPVTSVNTFTGAVTLAAADVGAIAANAALPISQITGLQTQLTAAATTTSAVNDGTTGLATKTSAAGVQAILTLSSFVKRADYVSTNPITGSPPGGQQSADSQLMPLNAIVLLTAQSSSVNNGLWIVNSGTWTRPADYATNSYLAKDTIIIITNTTASPAGAASNNTIWQATGTSGLIDTAQSFWSRIGYTAPPYAPTAGFGVAITGNSFAVNPATGGGLQVASGGVSVDPNSVPRKYFQTVPASNPAGITHNLNSSHPQVSIWDTGSNTLVLAGISATTANSISIEFASTPATGQYVVSVMA